METRTGVGISVDDGFGNVVVVVLLGLVSVLLLVVAVVSLDRTTDVVVVAVVVVVAAVVQLETLHAGCDVVPVLRHAAEVVRVVVLVKGNVVV